MQIRNLSVLALAASFSYQQSNAFAPPAATQLLSRSSQSLLFSSSVVATVSTEDAVNSVTETSDEDNALLMTPPSPNQEYQAVRAPLKFLGPYPCVSLRFPHLATRQQRDRNVTGVSLDFVLDTAANTNTINGQVAQELGLEVVGEALPGVGAAGAISGGDTYMLGQADLEGLPENEQEFMQGLTASALPIASPAAAGLLSLPFFHCFEGGVEFQWEQRSTAEETDIVPPAVTFFEQGNATTESSMTRVAITELPVTRLPSVEITVNGVSFPALLDTGSPITVLNAEAAVQAGIQTVGVPSATNTKKKDGGNPFFNFANRVKEAQAIARGDVLTIAGSTGEPVNLIKSEATVNVGLKGADNTDVSFGDSHLYVGNLPGLAALNSMGDNSPPAAVLGMDILRLKPKMLLKAKDKEVYF